MASTALHPPSNLAQYFFNYPQGPSPPDSCSNESGSTTTTMDSGTINLNRSLHISSGELYCTNYRDLRPRRRPLTVPAALRPTDFMSRPSTGHQSPNPVPRMGEAAPALTEQEFDFTTMTLKGQDHDRSHVSLKLSRTNDGTDLWTWGEEKPVTMEPTTARWKPDRTSEVCAICGVGFTWYWRRHHCRACGQLVCGNHVNDRVLLNEQARFHSEGYESKSCPKCYESFEAYKKMRNWVDPSAPVTVPERNLESGENQRVGSVDVDDWSTF